MKNTNMPSEEILEKYAKVLVNFALGGGKGIKKGDVVWLRGNESCKPLYVEVYREILRKGAHIIPTYSPSELPDLNLQKDFYQLAREHQINFFPEHYMKGLIKQVDHMLMILCEEDMRGLSGINSKKIMAHNHANKPFMNWRREKENLGKFSWTLALYGTEAMAREAGLSTKEYWDQIIKACFLDQADPIKKWKEVSKEIDINVAKLNKLQIETLQMQGPDADITVKIGKDRKWEGGGGANIPSFEIFTSPDWRGTNGWVRFNQPLYHYGDVIKGIYLEFKDGIICKATAEHNQKLLRDMIAVEGANKVGEFSMTDKRYSRITKFMAETLYDENIGGPNGNSHLAVGMAFDECYIGKIKLTKSGREQVGLNDSSVHTDIITTAPRTITATLQDGTKKIIYKNGQFTI